MTIIAYLFGYILLGLVIGLFPDIGIEISKITRCFVILFWPIVLVVFVILCCYEGIKLLVK